VWAKGAEYEWNAPGNTLADYHVAPDGSTATTDPLNSHTGLGYEELKFFWVSGSSTGPAAEMLAGHIFLNGNEYTSTATFNVYTPNATAITVKHAQAGTDFKGPGLVAGQFLAPDHTAVGIQWQANVQTPHDSGASFAAGRYFFVQTVMTKRKITLYGGPTVRSKYPEEYTLDETFPYLRGEPYDPGTTSWATDSGNHWKADKPQIQVNQVAKNPDGTFSVRPGGASSTQDSSAFETFVMYLPPGSESLPVPVAKLAWKYNVDTVIDKLGAIAPAGPQASETIPDTFSSQTMAEPTWSHLFTQESGYTTTNP